MNKNTILNYIILFIIFTFSYINSTQTVFANGQINYQFKESPPFKIGYGTTPEFPTIGNLGISLKVNYIDSEEPMIKGNISFIAKQPNQNDYSINKNMIETIQLGHYHSNIEIANEGIWEFKFTIHDGRQTKTISFESEVIKPDPYKGIFTSIALLAFIITLSLTIKTIIKNRSNNSIAS